MALRGASANVKASRRISEAPIDTIDILNPRLPSATLNLDAPKAAGIHAQAGCMNRWDSPRCAKEPCDTFAI